MKPNTKPEGVVARLLAALLVWTQAVEARYHRMAASLQRGDYRALMADTRGESSVDTLLGILILIVVFAALAKVVADIVADPGNLTGGALALYLLLPLFFMVVGIVLVFRGIKST